jgi:hypothetical protein
MTEAETKEPEAKLPIRRTIWLGRTSQFLGVAIAVHAVTRWSTICQIVSREGLGEADARSISAFIYMFIGVCVGVVFLWSGVYLESLARRKR